MFKDLKDLSAFDKSYIYISITDPNYKGICTDQAEFVWAIGDYGRNIILAGFLTMNFLHYFSKGEVSYEVFKSTRSNICL